MDGKSNPSPWRIGQADWTRLTVALVLSIVLHLSMYGTYELGKKAGWWRRLRLPDWLQPARVLPGLIKKEDIAQPKPEETEIPLEFVDVSPAQAVSEPPKKTPFYSDKNSAAANPDPKVETEAPRIDGKQTRMTKTEDVPREKAFPLQPAVPAQPLPTPEPPQEEIKPKQASKPGDLALAKPAEIPRKETPRQDDRPEQLPKPKTVKEAKARLPNNQQLSGEKMKQDGGVKRAAIRSSLDVTSTAFGAYDAAIIAAIQNRWYDLLDARLFAADGIGKVTIRFRLHADGTITEMSFVENTVDLALGLVCQSAIRDGAPYSPWPIDMRRKIGAEYREVLFTFYYN